MLYTANVLMRTFQMTRLGRILLKQGKSSEKNKFA